ncbi:PDZK1-interacting protein 1 [Rhineura floridana]|uniref:PDZK1-interacting protein 1 n=1 Tax=Rhineura floridana TaxID=261503 RepID=UPI002AC80C92|nr:PDZK1-interacting protein 1 [Rhineura floridana]XP_061488903.1 PDZK1-interacting protein 1 [Rhineura floridana]XP_061488904.1 PDZK1-interacting protein 1 [Rhineura floridana]XP_061488905.1 PDZK1-interacting protein 1 [Rhineura floridana]XP_061488907.1 PDZK1-interacting protein 1 [Rhineura floridana]
MNAALAVVTFCLLVALEPVNCQRVQRQLQPWVQGTIAVTVFLILAMIAFVINRFWCQEKNDSFEEKNEAFSMGGNKAELPISNGSEGRYSMTAADFRCEEGPHVYEKKVEFECGNTSECHGEHNIDVLTTCM